MRWMLILDGTERSERAAEYAAGLILPKEDEVLLLTGSPSEAGDPSASLERLEPHLSGIRVTRIDAADLSPSDIEQATKSAQADLVVYGSRGRKGWTRWMLGSVAAYLERHLTCSLLVVRGSFPTARNILVATSLFAEQSRSVELGGRIARRTGAQITLLHVMSQLPLKEEVDEIPLRATAEEAIRLQTREGLLLQEQLNYFNQLGIQATARLRHGLVLDEVAAEMREGGFDLLIIGAHRIPDSLPFGSLLAEDVTEALLMSTSAPVLIA